MKSILKHLLLGAALFLAGFIQPTSAFEFGMNDVSLLLPLPTEAEFPAMLSPESAGAKGNLLPKAVYQKLGFLIDDQDPDAIYQNELKVVAIRIDPCFFESVVNADQNPPCQRQIRLVWQPLVHTANGLITTEDAAIHTFYHFSAAAWTDLLVEWQKISVGNRSLPLQIHPSLLAEGYAGKTWTNLRRLILSVCGQNNLTRATVMRLNLNRMWTFLGFSIDASAFSILTIPRVANSVETYVLDAKALTQLSEFDGKLAPAPTEDTSLIAFLASSAKLKNAGETNKILSTVREAVQFENPSLHNTGSVDCASCHLAQIVRNWGENNFPEWNWKNEMGSSLFSSSMPLQNLSVNPNPVNRLRAFGYVGSDAIFSQRVINETAKVSEALNATSGATP